MRKLVNTIQAAEILGLKPNTLEIWRCHKRGPKYVKLGRRILYDPAELESFTASCTVETSPVPGRTKGVEDVDG